jgi:GTP-binding protein
MESSLSHNTLVHFRFNPEHKSQRGGHGLGSNCSGYSGEQLTLKVPVGTVLYDDDTGEQIHDFTRAGDSIVIARGGRGGRGNQHFATSTHQAPREHELGRAGEERNYRLELRLLADAGLVGYPNVGKSTLISRVSAAKPKIANYAFTTLEPNLGVVSVGDWPHEQSFTIADLPASSKAQATAPASAFSSSSTSSAPPSSSISSTSPMPPAAKTPSKTSRPSPRS